MALTKVTGGILSQPIDLGITTATTGFFSGIVTAQSVRVLGDLKVDGSTTTLDTVVTEVDKLEVGADNVTVGVAITQSGTGDILNLYDGSNKEFSVADGGTVKISQSMAFQQSDRVTTAGLLGRGSLLLAGTQQTDFAIRSNPHNSNLILGVGVTERLRIDSNGRVLIGTTTEGAGGADELTIANTSSSSGITIRSSTTATGNIYFSDGTSSTNQYRGVVRYDHNDNYMSLWSNASERLRIESDGGIILKRESLAKIITDATDKAIYIAGGNDTIVGGNINLFGSTHASHANHLRFRAGSTVAMEIDENGNIGIGTATPTSLLTLGASSNPVLEFKDYTNNARSQILGSAGGQLIFQTDITRVNSNSDFIFRADGGDSTYEIVRFKDTGEVGIGTGNPTEKLEVKYGKAWIDNSSGDSVARSDGLTVSHSPDADFAVAGDPTDSLRAASFIAKGGSRAAIVTLRNVSDNSAFWDFIADGNTNKFYIQRGSNTGAALGPAVSIDTNLNIGIGTANTVGARLRVHEDGLDQMLQQWGGSLGSTTGQRFMQLFSPATDSGNDYFRFQTGNAFKFQVDTIDALCIKSDGKVGIGTATQSAKLDVYVDNTDLSGIIQVTQDGTGDAAIDFQLKGTREYSLGIDNSDSDKFKLSGSAGLANNTLLTVTNSGNIGIGTDNPGTKLDVFGFLQVKDETGKLSMQVDGANGNFKVFQSPPGWNNLTYNPSPILAWDFKSGPGDLMYMASGGNTAVGTQMALVISDEHGFKVGRSGYDGSDFDVSSTAEWFRIAKGGFVGIGTNAPQTKLHLRQDFDNNTDGFRISRTNSAASYSQYIDTNARFNIGYSNPSTADPSPQITLDQNGYVGINQSTPTSLLTIKDETGGQSLLIEGSGGNDVVVLGSVNGATNRGELILKEGTTGIEYVKLSSRASTPSFIINNNFGIGTNSPTQKLEVHSGQTGRPTFRHSGGFGGVQIAGPQNASGASLMFTRGYDVVGGGTTTYSIFLDGSTQGLHFISGDPSEFQTKTRLLLDSSGKVGIKTTSPTAQLSIGNVTGGYMNADGIQVNRPHSLGLKNGIIVYSDAGYNPTASYRAAAFKAVGTTGIALGISTDQGSNGLGGTLNARIGFDGGAYFLGNVGIGTDNPSGQLHISSGTSGDCRVYIEADTDNNNEGDNPFIIFKNDGGVENASVWCGNASGGNDNSLNLSAATSVNGGIRFFTSSTDGGWETAPERLRITNNGMTFNGDTAADNALNDYEIGTWTPTVVSEGTIGTPQYTCTYTKIGRLVTINADIHQLSDTTSDSHILIGGLPYVPTRTGGNWSAVCHGERYGHKDIIVAYLLYTGGAWRIGFRYGVPLNHYSYVKHSNISDDGSDNNLRFTLTYELAT